MEVPAMFERISYWVRAGHDHEMCRIQRFRLSKSMFAGAHTAGGDKK
jgi:hypothetical protein